MRKRLTLSLIVLSAILLAAVVYAAAGYSFLCLNKDCGYKTEVIFGGGKIFRQITGYCVNCREFVYLRWPQPDKPNPPVPVARIWDASTGQTLDLYACPKCAKPFLPIKDAKDLTHCPRCGKDAIQKTLEEAID